MQNEAKQTLYFASMRKKFRISFALFRIDVKKSGAPYFYSWQTWSGCALKIFLFFVGGAFIKTSQVWGASINTQHISSNCAGVGGNGNGLNMSRKPITEFFKHPVPQSDTNTYRLSLLLTPNLSGRTLPLTWQFSGEIANSCMSLHVSFKGT